MESSEMSVNSQMSVNSDNDDALLIKKLMAKVQESAVELGRLNSHIESQSAYIEKLENDLTLQKEAHQQIFSTTSTQGTTPGSMSNSHAHSDAAAKKKLDRQQREKIDALERQLEACEKHNLENNKLKNKLSHELECKTREVNFFEKHVHEVQSENQELKSLLDNIFRVCAASVSSLTKATTVSQHKLNTHKKSQYVSICDDIRQLKEELDKSKLQSEKSREALTVM